MENQLENEELRQARWAQRKAEMKREKKKQEFFRKSFKIGIVLIAVAIVSLTAIRIKDVGKHKGTTENGSRHDNSQDFVVKAQTEPIQSETETLENITEENYEDNHIKTQETQEIQDTKIQNEKTKDNNALSQSMHTISMLVKIPKPAGVMDNINVQNKTYQYTAAENMVALGDEVVSNNAILVDIESGMIGTVITKDLSRLGRNFIETAYYIGEYFPRNHVRYIAINDQFDSDSSDIHDQQIMMEIKALINDWYVKDVSTKRKQVASTKTEDGQFIGVIAPYGYKIKKENGRRTLKIDEYSAGIVKRIFTEIASGKARSEVAEGLNKDKITPPIIYMNMTQSKKKKYCFDWSDNIVYRILKNKTYTGKIVKRTIDK